MQVDHAAGARDTGGEVRKVAGKKQKPRCVCEPATTVEFKIRLAKQEQK